MLTCHIAEPLPALPALPVEVWNMISGMVDKKSLKRLRLTSKTMNEIATPFCYETVRFDLVEEWPLQQLIEIARHEQLRKHVKRLVLQRRYGLREIYPQSDWERCILFSKFEEEEQQEKHERSAESFSFEDPMSKAEWLSLSGEGKNELYAEYNADYAEQKARARRVTMGWQFKFIDCNASEKHADLAHNKWREPTSFSHLFQQFDGAIRSLQNLFKFSHEPAYANDPSWSTKWRRLRFNETWIAFGGITSEEEDVEALQLSFSLRALGWANYFNHNLRSLKLHIDGQAFWGATRLQRLWQGNDELTASYLDSDFTSLDDQRALTEQANNPYIMQLLLMKQAFNKLEHLDLMVSINNPGVEENEILDFLFDYLNQCKLLTRLKVLIGVLDYNSIYIVEHSEVKRLLSQMTLARSWQSLVQLELGFDIDENALVGCLSSMAGSLRKLALHRVRLLQSQGTFCSLLPKLGKILTLDELKLSDLMDHFPRERAILKKDLWVWQRNANIDRLVGVGYDQRTGWYTEYLYKFEEAKKRKRFENVIPCYEHHEKEIISAIRNQTTLPELDPLMYLRAHRHVCEDYRYDGCGRGQEQRQDLDPSSNPNVVLADDIPHSIDDIAWSGHEKYLQNEDLYVQGLLMKHFHASLIR